MDSTQLNQRLNDIYGRLMARYGPQRWWPAQTPFEVMVGAILTQSAAWINVEKAINNLKSAGALSPGALRALTHADLARLVHSCGYYNAKTTKLKALADLLGKYEDNLERIFVRDTETLRAELLATYGIGEETADSILLYAAQKPVFVIDAYTRRIINRLGIAPGLKKYADYQHLFMDNLPADSRLFNEYHALLVRLAKETCRTTPLCTECCLKDICITGRGSAKLSSEKARPKR